MNKELLKEIVLFEFHTNPKVRKALEDNSLKKEQLILLLKRYGVIKPRSGIMLEQEGQQQMNENQAASNAVQNLRIHHANLVKQNPEAKPSMLTVAKHLPAIINIIRKSGIKNLFEFLKKYSQFVNNKTKATQPSPTTSSDFNLQEKKDPVMKVAHSFQDYTQRTSTAARVFAFFKEFISFVFSHSKQMISSRDPKTRAAGQQLQGYANQMSKSQEKGS